MGGSKRTDGTDAVSTGTSNAMNIPAEFIDMDYPVRVTHYERVPDSGVGRKPIAMIQPQCPRCGCRLARENGRITPLGPLAQLVRAADS